MGNGHFDDSLVIVLHISPFKKTYVMGIHENRLTDIKNICCSHKNRLC